MRATQQGLLKLALRAGRGRMDLSTRTTSAKACLQRMPVAELISVIVTTYNCDAPAACWRAAQGRRICDRGFAPVSFESRPGARPHRMSATSPISSPAMRFARDADCPRRKPRL